MKLYDPTRWLRSALLVLPLAAAPLVLDQAAVEFGLAPLSAAIAQESGGDQRETRRTPALRNAVYEKLAEAQAAAEAQDLAGAARVLDDMISTSGKNELNSYELANVYNFYAFIHYSREDYTKALQAYENVIRQPDIPLAMEINTRYTVAQLYFVQEQWQQGVNALLAWFSMTENPSEDSYVLLGQGYYQLNDYPKALTNVEKAISLYKEKGKVPKEQWYNLARFLYFDKNDVTNAVRVLEELLTHYPDKQYWVQLSHMYGEQKREGDQLSA
ncbi:MAG: tetratricopeptide repeat protein, partial [Haliea sp.]|nr:tetratricopeptide repeat protein [Haliea sp.]